MKVGPKVGLENLILKPPIVVGQEVDAGTAVSGEIQ
jgi:hypothetical protein